MGGKPEPLPASQNAYLYIDHGLKSPKQLSELSSLGNAIENDSLAPATSSYGGSGILIDNEIQPV